jgi:hypothetical protein
MSDIEWAEPPALNPGRDRGSGITQRFVEELKTRHGEWAIYPGQIKNSHSLGRYRQSFPGVEWRARQGTVYARWVGTE